jgi:hypothetical protein
VTGFNSKRGAAADKLQEPVCDKDPQGCWNVRCQLNKQCKNLAQPAQERQWIWLSDADIAEVLDTTCQYTGSYEEFLIKKAEQKIKSMNT